MNCNTLKWPILIASLVLAGGCATSTIESRKEERLAAYQALPVEWQHLIDQGQIKIGMPEEAVYIAWGEPAQILRSETGAGPLTTWLYHGHWMRETRYWSYREVQTRDGVFLERYLDRDYHPRSYISAEITFVDGVVKSWRTLPRPAY
jgi:hypothetical protein